MSPDATAGTAPARGDGIVQAPPGSRSAKQIRSDIVRQRAELSESVEALRGRVSELTDWRQQVRRHRRELIVGAAIVGALVGGAIALRRRRE